MNLIVQLRRADCSFGLGNPRDRRALGHTSRTLARTV